MLRDLLFDLRFGLRSLRRSPALVTTVVASLALGIGANGAIFSVLNALMLRPLPVSQAERLVFLSDSLGSGRIQRRPADSRGPRAGVHVSTLRATARDHP